MDGSLAGGTYEIVIGATLGADWTKWFEGFEVETSGSTTVLRGTVSDQSALHGILAQLRDLAVPLLDVHQIEGPEETDVSPGTGAAERTTGD